MDVFRVRDLHKSFGSTHAVRGLSLSVERGQIFGLLGPNGSGKTTTLACALGLVRPSSGSATVLGEPAGRICRTRGSVGAVFDSATLLPGLRAVDNLRYARSLFGHAGGRRPEEALALVGIADLAQRRAGKLSLGQQKRVAIARALLGCPELLILDEPLAGLDPLGVRSMLALFRELAGEGLTLILSSHRLHEMESVVTHAAIVHSGKIAASGSLTELLDADVRHYRLSATPTDLVLRVLTRVAGASLVGDPPEAHEPAMRVELRGADAATLNRTLVEAGCEVSELTPEGRSLPALFERLVDGPAPEAVS